MEIGGNVVSSANIRQHAEIIKDKSTMRQVIRMATSILEDAYTDGEAPKAVIKRAEENIYRMGEAARGAMEGLLDMQGCISRTANRLNDLASGKPNRVRLGISAIDDIMRGLRFGSLNLLAARPGIGKSALALQAAVECKEPVALFSLEMMIEEEIERLMAHLDPSLNADGISTQALVLAKQEAIKAAFAKLSQYPIEICDSSKVTPAFILGECRRMKRRRGKLGMVIVDYLQMVKSASTQRNREAEVGGISGELKQIGNELVCPILAVASLSRKCEEREDKRPTDADLRDSGQLESDAHGIIFLYRHSKYNDRAKKDERIKNITEVKISKNRGGPTGQTLLDFKGSMSWFFPVAQSEQAYYQSFLSGADFQDGGGNTPTTAGKKYSGPSRKSKTTATPSDNWGSQADLEF
jgi:replicative DNA helicase